MSGIENLEWSALEYEEKERNADWFWALGVIVVTSAATAIIYGNYFFAVLLVLGGLLLGFFANKKPDVVFYQLDENGLKIGNRLYSFENIKAFWVQMELATKAETEPTLFIKAERLFMPIISIPIENDLAKNIRNTMLAKNIPEEEMRESPSEKIMESLGF
jgi:hypothetical protein